MEDLILKHICESLHKNEIVALAVITESSGSSPRKSGSLMAVWQDRKTIGSVGGGIIEAKVIDKALACIKNKTDDNFSYTLTEEESAMQCGGNIKGYIKVFYPKERLIIIGSGHISINLYKLAKVLNFYTVIIDEREEFANKDRFGDADEVIVSDIDKTLTNYQTSENDYIVIVTNGHKNDLKALKILANKKAKYKGMIGSEKKVKHVMNELINQGISKDELQKVYSPIGINIANSLPEEIALSILSEILLIKNNGSLEHMKNIKNIWE